MAQVNFFDQIVCQDGFCVAFSDQSAIVDDVSGFADIQRFTHVVVGNQYTDTLGLEVVDDLLYEEEALRHRLDA